MNKKIEIVKWRELTKKEAVIINDFLFREKQKCERREERHKKDLLYRFSYNKYKCDVLNDLWNATWEKAHFQER